MAHRGSDYRPPLPPRSLRPSAEAQPGPGYSHFPPPPSSSPRPAFDSRASTGSVATGPPISSQPGPVQSSPSPLGHHSSSFSSPILTPPPNGGVGYASFPPPPVSPNRPPVIHPHRAPPPLPPRPQLQVPGQSSSSEHGAYNYAPPKPTLTPSALSPNQLTSFPPPPPGPPPLRTSPSPVSQSSVHHFQPTHEPPAFALSSHGQQDNGGFRSKLPLPPDPPHDPEIPSSPPPAYTPLAGPSDFVSPATSPAPQPVLDPVAAYPMFSPEVRPSSPVIPNYTAFPVASFAQATTPSPLPSPAVGPFGPPQRATYSAPASPLVGSSVSNPQSPDAISFFPVPPLPGTPMSQKDPIEELMQSLSVTSTPAPENSPTDVQTGRSSSALSTPADDVQLSLGFNDESVAPLRPPKRPLGNGTVSHSSASGSQKALIRKPVDTSKQVESTPTVANLPSWKPNAVVSSCIDIPMTFLTTWYSHPGAPAFLICSRCYTDHIAITKFASSFQSSVPADAKPRVCRFSKPRLRDNIFPAALATSYLQPVIDYMRRRSGITDCRGADGVVGATASAANIKWYSPSNNAIPGFVTCEACYEDYAGCTPGLAGFFQLHPQVQGPRELWACDFALPFIQKEYEADSKDTIHHSGWSKFASKAKSRIGVPRCAQAQPVKSQGKKWFRPVAGPHSLIICAACYCDQVLHTGEESKWQVATGLSEARDVQVRCAMGAFFNIRIAMARAHEAKDFSLFWKSVEKIDHHPQCEVEGIKDAEWWTLPHQPNGFQVCGACFAGICEPLGVQELFEKESAPSSASDSPRCCFNIAHPRLKHYMPRLLEMYFTHNPAALVEYARVYAAIPPCCRDDARPGYRWYGWEDCTICAECFQDFARHHELSRIMPLRNALMEQDVSCDMYSPRMRQLYVSCSQKSATDPSELLSFARQRSQVYARTVPQIKQIIMQQKLALNQQKTLNALSTFHTHSGQIQQITTGSSYVYSAASLGSFRTVDELQGAAYGREAMSIVGNSHNALASVKMLEQQWRAVE